MRRITILVGLCVFVCLSVTAQPRGPSAEHQTAMAKLDWLVGEWTGKGEFLRPDGKWAVADQTERVEKRLGGLVIVVDGQGKVGEQTLHEAFGVFAYDPNAKKHLFRTFTAEGYYVDAEVSVRDDGSVTWKFDSPRGLTRYETTRAADGTWQEVGYLERKDAEPVKFLQMTLKKTK